MQLAGIVVAKVALHRADEKALEATWWADF